MAKPLVPKPLALTLGEPAGIGPDITIAAWLRRKELNLPPFYLLGDRAFVARRAKALGASLSLVEVAAEEVADAFAKALPVVATDQIPTAEPGRPDESSAPAALASIRQAVADISSGRAAAIVTNPIAKNVLYKYGFADPGHTEYLARLSFEQSGDPA